MHIPKDSQKWPQWFTSLFISEMEIACGEDAAQIGRVYRQAIEIWMLSELSELLHRCC